MDLNPNLGLCAGQPLPHAANRSATEGRGGGEGGHRHGVEGASGISGDPIRLRREGSRDTGVAFPRRGVRVQLAPGTAFSSKN